MKGRKIVFGDIHGGLKGLDQVIHAIGLRKEDELFFLGDYVDGWSEAFGVIERLLQLEKWHRCNFLIGNHDLWLLDWLKTNTVDDIWYENGGKETMASYGLCTPEQKAAHLHFLERAKYLFVDEERNLFVHAGFTSTHGPLRETYPSNYSSDRTFWEMVVCMDRNLDPSGPYFPNRLKHNKEIFVGHTSTTRYGFTEPMNIYNVWNVDTGAGFRGKLSALDVESKTFWQSETLESLYPNETGRNKKL